MGKRIISQRRGRATHTYRVRKKAFQHKISYPSAAQGETEILSLIKSAGHTAPLMKMKAQKTIFFIPAFQGAVVGEKITLGPEAKPETGNILQIKNIPLTTQVYNIERHPGDGGKLIRSAGSSATITKDLGNNKFIILMPNKKELTVSGECRATVGTIAGAGRQSKPFMTAGKKYFHMKARSKLWPRTSAVSMNAIDHPFGSGRGKRIKRKIAKRNSPPGRRVGHLSPKRTGKKR
ncbi:50S ribosomal protein L2 [Candidatus Pacearchaeota archaeon]|nr:50S ribosomal protein L2 [Candidatus Pacearchaeota archaeon]